MTRDLQTLRARYSINNFGTNSRLWDDLQFLLTSLTEMEGRVKELGMKMRQYKDRFESERNICIRYAEQLDQAKASLTKLKEAVERHKWLKWGYADSEKGKMYQVGSEADEELYRTRDEVGKEKT